ncbi:MAG: phosphonate C-P lyase system protein PhnG, partial [bacterium]|nr:phosphonate C-P lyase system protein PhnG [bacterium]
MGSSERHRENPEQARRKAAMAVLAGSPAAEIATRLTAVAVPDHEELREPESGLVMVRGRVGGDGAAFNLGEATVSRAGVRLSTGEVGFGYVLGRDRQKARMIALCDAMVQSSELA